MAYIQAVEKLSINFKKAVSDLPGGLQKGIHSCAKKYPQHQASSLTNNE